MLDIFKLIYEYSKNGKFVDKEFIERLVQLEIRLKNLGSYIQHTNIHKRTDDPNDIGIQASYSERTLHVFMEEINKLFESADKYLCLFSSGEEIFYRNSIIVQILLHEIEHANQERKEDNVNSIEASILRIAECNMQGLNISSVENVFMIMAKLKYLQLYYHANYKYSPHERLAEIKSNNEVVRILSPFSEYIPNLLNFFKTQELESTIMGYIDESASLISPTLKYLQGIGMDTYLPQFSWYDKENFSTLNATYKDRFSFEERLIYGFPITDREYQKVYQTLMRSKKWNC